MDRRRSRALGALAAGVALAPLRCALELHSPTTAAEAEGPCSCLNWKEMYNSGQATCSHGHLEGLEQPAAMREALVGLSPAQALDAQLCDRFLTQIDDNVCLNVNLGQTGNEPSSQWCYVSPECQRGVPANSTGGMLLKQCSAEQDTMLREKSPEELFSFALTKGISPAISMKTAYPVEKGLLPLRVRAFFGLEPNVRIAAPRPAVLARIKELREGAGPVVLDSLDSLPPFAVLQGQKTFLVEHDSLADRDDGEIHAPVAPAQALWSKHFTLQKLS